MATRYNNRKIIESQQTIPISKILPGMIITFNYAEEKVTDPRPILLFLHYNRDTKNIEGLNMNYINPTKIKKLFQVIDFKKTKIDEVENLISLKEEYFRIQISNPKKRSAMSTKRFYGDIVSAEWVPHRNGWEMACRAAIPPIRWAGLPARGLRISVMRCLILRGPIM